MKNQFYISQKTWALAGLLAFLAFLAMSFQNFTFKSEPLSFGSNSQTELQNAVLNEVQVSDVEKKNRREAMENGAFDRIQPKRGVDSIPIDADEVYEGGARSDDMAQSPKDL